MNKENVKQSTVDIFCEKKELEKSCLDNAISKVPWLQKFKLIEDELKKIPNEKVHSIAVENIKNIKESNRRDFRF